MDFTELTNILDSFLGMGIPGYDCAVYKDGSCIYRRMGGYADRERKIPVMGNETYNLYSSSKMITCTAALMLFEKGAFELTDPLSKYMPEFAEMYVNDNGNVRRAKTEITVKDLFCMTAGFSYKLNSPMLLECAKDTKGACPTREVMRYLAKEPLLYDPGEKWVYSLSHDVLAALVEVISGMRFGEFVRRNIFEPLGMEHSTFLPDDAQIDALCPKYRHDPKTKTTEAVSKTNSYRLGSEYESGGAGCVSTLNDFVLFLEGLRTGKLLRDDTLDIMATNQLNEKQEKHYHLMVDERGYGLGVSCALHGENRVFGWGGAAGAYPLIDPDSGLTFFYIQHVLNAYNDERNHAMQNFFIEKLTGNAG